MIVKKGIKGLWKKRYYQISQRLCICWRHQLGRLVKIESNTLTKPLLNVSEDLFSSSMRMNPSTLWLTIKGKTRVVVGLILHCTSALAQARIRQFFVLFSGYERFFCYVFFSLSKESAIWLSEKGISSIRGSHKYVITYARCPKSERRFWRIKVVWYEGRAQLSQWRILWGWTNCWSPY